MKQKIIAAFLFSVVLLLAWLIFVFHHQLQPINDFRGIKIGDHCPGFFWIEDDLKEKNISKPAKFILIFISDKVDPDADGLDNEKYFTKIVKIIKNKGGHLWCSGDGKVARIYGVNFVCGVKEWKLDSSLIVVTDGAGGILDLYKNAKLEDIKRVADNLNL